MPGGEPGLVCFDVEGVPQIDVVKRLHQQGIIASAAARGSAATEGRAAAFFKDMTSLPQESLRLFELGHKAALSGESMPGSRSARGRSGPSPFF